jgi:hypothetical protein
MVASTGTVSPATALDVKSPPSTWGRMSSITMRPIMVSTLPSERRGVSRRLGA